MPTAILRPNGDINATWSVTGATSRWDAVDDAITQPTAGSTTERIFTATSGVAQDLDLTTITGIGSVSQVVIWMYSATAGNDLITASLHLADGTQVGTSAATTLTTTSTWYSITLSGLSLTQAQVDGLRLRLTSGVAGKMAEVSCAAAYVEITYEAPYVPVIEGAYATAVAGTAGLVGYWRLGESTGAKAYDDSGNGNHGTISGPVMGTAGLLTGDTNTAYTFDGVNDTVNMGNATAFQLTTNVTLEAWIKTANAGTSARGIFVKSESYGLFMLDNEIAFFDWTALVWRQTGVFLNDDVRHHVVARFQSGVTNGSTLVVDGTLRWTGTYTVTNNQTFTLGVGYNTSNTQYFTGIIDEPALYNVLLSDATITDHYNKGTGASASTSATFVVSAGGASAPAVSASIITPSSASMQASTATASSPAMGATAGSVATFGAQTSSVTAPVVGATAGSAASLGVQTSAASAPAIISGISEIASLLVSSASGAAPNASTTIGSLAPLIVSSSAVASGDITSTAAISTLAQMVAASLSGTSPAVSATAVALATLLVSTSPFSAPSFAATAGASLVLAAASSGGNTSPIVATGGSLAALLASTVPIAAPSALATGGALSSLSAASTAASTAAIEAGALVAIVAQMVAALGGLSASALAATGGNTSAMVVVTASSSSPPIDGLIGISAPLIVSNVSGSADAVAVTVIQVASLVSVTSAGNTPALQVVTGALSPLQVASGGAMAPAFDAREFVILYYPWPERTITTLVPDGPATATTLVEA